LGARIWTGVAVAILQLFVCPALAQETQSFLRPEEQALLSRAAEMEKAGRNEEALASVDQVVTAITQRLGSRDIRVAAVYHKVASAVWRLDLAASDKYYEKALKIAQDVIPEKDTKYLFKFFSAYAMSKLREDQYPRAKTLLDQAADADLSELLKTVMDMAGDFRLAGDYVRSEWLWRYLLEQLQPVADTQHSIFATIYNQLGILLGARGDIEGAKKYYAMAIAAAESAYGPTSPKLQPFLFNLAQLHEKQAEYADAEPLYRRALSNSEADPQDKDGLASNLSNLGVLWLKTNRKQEGRKLIERAVEIRRGIRQDSRLAALLINLASACSGTGDDELAEKYYREAIDMATKDANVDRTAMMAMSELASFYLDHGRKTEADTLLDRAATMNEKGLTSLDPDLADWFTSIATLYLNAGDCNLSLSYMQRGSRVWEKNLALLMTAGTQEQRQRYLAQSDLARHIAVSIHHNCFASREDVARFAYESVLEWKGRGVDAFADQLAQIRLRGRPEERVLLNQYADMAGALAAASPGNTEALNSNIRSIESQISTQSAEFRSLRARPSFELVRHAIPPEAALVEIFAHLDVKPGNTQGTPRYMAYVTLPERPGPTLVELGFVKDVDGVVRDWRKALTDPSRKDVDALGARLYGVLFAPLVPQLGSVKSVIIAPDGQMNLVPFAALVGPDHRYLVDHYDITYIPSGRDLLRQAFQESTSGSVVVFADPAYDLDRHQIDSDPAFRSITAVAAGLTNGQDVGPSAFAGVRYGRLRLTADEAAAIQRAFPLARIWLQEQATEQALKSIHRPSILHVATHGFFVGRGKGQERSNALLRTGLVLAGVTQGRSGEREDGVLTAMEMSTMDLTGTQLVVLSACDTGVGEVRVGDGVYGLRRALLLAGAASQVISLWEVENASTKDLMAAFYGGLKNGLERSQALRAAQLKIEKENPERQHPFYWAAFLLSGDRGPIHLKPSGAAK
jgi:CHAT domain-containing protein/tetratricopeptide (TPR) repeat protein